MEQWKDVKGFEGFYQVSNYGRVKSLDRKAYKNGKYEFLLKGRVLKGGKDGNGYLFYYLCTGDSKTCKKGHTLVLENFVGERKLGYECNHKNGVKIDNRVENLEWVTKSEQHKHRHHILGHKAPNPWGGIKGENNPFSITIGQYDGEGKLIKNWIGIRGASRELNIDQSSIVRVCKGKQKIAGGFTWKYL